MSNPNELVVVFSGNTFEAGSVITELENNGIPAFKILQHITKSNAEE